MYLLQWVAHPLKPCLSGLSVSLWPPPVVAYQAWCSWVLEQQFSVHCMFLEVAACLCPEKSGTVHQHNLEIVNNSQFTMWIFQSVYKMLAWSLGPALHVAVDGFCFFFFSSRLQHQLIARVNMVEFIITKVLFSFPISDSSFPIL